jgi:hypothetical protein
MKAVRRRLGGVVVGVAVAVSVAAGAAAFASDTVARPGSAAVAALRFSYPGRFDRRDFASCSYMVTGVHGACVSGVVVASYRLSREPELGAPGADFPRGEVAFELYRAPRQHPVVVAQPVRFPLSLADFHAVGNGLGVQQSDQQRELFFRIVGANYWAIAWVGKGASKANRAALASIVSSARIK